MIYWNKYWSIFPSRIVRESCVCKRWYEIVNSMRFLWKLSQVLSQKLWYFMFTSSEEPVGYTYDPSLRKCTYEHNGKKRNMAVAQFESTYARHCFPYWDEPACKVFSAYSESIWFNKRRADHKDKNDGPKKNLQLKVRKVNPVNTISYVQVLNGFPL